MDRDVPQTHEYNIMSIYAMAAQQGTTTAVGILTGTDSPATIAAYNASYQAKAKQFAMLDARHAAELNLSSVKADKILTDRNIQLKQNQAEAAARSQAAWAGVGGQTLDDIVFETQSSEARQLARSAKQSAARTEGVLHDVNSATAGFMAIQTPPEPDALAALLTAFSSTTLDDLKDGKAFMTGSSSGGESSGPSTRYVRGAR